MSRSRIFLYFCLAFIAGIAVSSFVFISQLWQLVFLIVGIFLISLFWGRKKIILAGFCLLFLSLGVWRHQTALSEIIYPIERQISFIGTVVQEPDIREDNIKLTIMSDVKSVENGSRPFGRVLVTVSRYPEYQYGDKLKVSGQLKVPVDFDDFSYKDYLAKDGVYSVMYWPKAEVIAENQGNFIYAKILGFKNKLRESIYGNLSPPQSSILGAMILGDQRRMSDELKDKLNSTGLRHITAISGMHVTIIALILMQFLLIAGLWRSQAFYITLLFLGIFILMVGLPASAVRAGFMAGAFLFAQKIGRASSSFRLLILIAALMLALNPLLLRSDVGFQLSFLAVMGIIFLGPRLQWRLQKFPENKFINLRTILSMTVSAQVFTLPILLLSFGKISLVATITNILVLPVLPFILGAGFAAGLAGMIWQSLGWLFSLPVWLMLTYVAEIVHWFSLLPLASINF